MTPEPALTLLQTIHQHLGVRQLSVLRGEQPGPDTTPAEVKAACAALPFDFPLPALARRVNELSSEWPEATQEIRRLALNHLATPWSQSGATPVTALYLACQLDALTSDQPETWPQVAMPEHLEHCWPFLCAQAGSAWLQHHARALAHLCETVAAQAERDGNRIGAKNLRLSLPSALSRSLPPRHDTPVFSWAAGQAAHAIAAHYPLGQGGPAPAQQLGHSELQLTADLESVSHQRRNEWWAGIYGSFSPSASDDPIHLLRGSPLVRQAPPDDHVGRARRLLSALHEHRVRLNFLMDEAARDVMSEQGRGPLARWLLLLQSLSHREQRWNPSDHLWINPSHLKPGEEDNATWQTNLTELAAELISEAKAALREADEETGAQDRETLLRQAGVLLASTQRLCGLLERELDVGNDTLKTGCDLFAPATRAALRRTESLQREAKNLRSTFVLSGAP